jgi:transcriptional regulator with XRE-family HTH domain
MADDLAQRLAKLLETSLADSGISQRQLEERLGWTQGSVGRILKGESQCEPRLLLEILGELGEAERSRPGRAARRRPGSSSMVDDLLERARLLGYHRPASPPVEGPGDAELEETVRGALRRAFLSFQEEEEESEE